MQKELEKKWETYGRLFMTIELLKESDPVLHTEYLAIAKAGYIVVHGGDNGFTKFEYDAIKHNVHTKIINWAKQRYESGKESIPDTLYDYFTHNTYPRTHLTDKTLISNKNLKSK